MLSQVCSKVGRYSHAPVANPKIHQVQRQMNHTSNANSRLVRMTRDCIAELTKVEINPSLQKTMQSIQDTYYDDLQLMTEEEYNALPDHAIREPDFSWQAKERAQAVQVYRGIGAVARFLDNYGVHAPGMSLCDAIDPNHKNYLIDSLHRSFPQLSSLDQRALATVIRPDVLSKLNLPCSSEEKRLSSATQLAGTPQLDENHVIALLDYCNSVTRNFNAVNDSKRTLQLCNVDTLASITSCLSKPLEEGLQILSMYQPFIYKGPAWKGIALLEPAGQFRLSRIQPGMSYTSPHWSSVTHIEKENYAEKGDGYRTCKLSIADAEGVHVHMFNDISSIRQGEVMLPPEPMYFTESPKSAKKSAAIAIHVYCTMKPNPSETEGDAMGPHAIRA